MGRIKFLLVIFIVKNIIQISNFQVFNHILDCRAHSLLPDTVVCVLKIMFSADAGLLFSHILY